MDKLEYVERLRDVTQQAYDTGTIEPFIEEQEGELDNDFLQFIGQVAALAKSDGNLRVEKVLSSILWRLFDVVPDGESASQDESLVRQGYEVAVITNRPCDLVTELLGGASLVDFAGAHWDELDDCFFNQVRLVIRRMEEQGDDDRAEYLREATKKLPKRNRLKLQEDEVLFADRGFTVDFQDQGDEGVSEARALLQDICRKVGNPCHLQDFVRLYWQQMGTTFFNELERISPCDEGGDTQDGNAFLANISPQIRKLHEEMTDSGRIESNRLMWMASV